GRRALVTTHDELKQVLRGRVRELPHPEIIDDEQGHGREVGEKSLTRAIEGGVGDVFNQRVRLAIDHAIALLDRRAPNRLREMALAGARGTEKERVFALADEAGRRQLVD